jgi:hypothetical protein
LQTFFFFFDLGKLGLKDTVVMTSMMALTYDRIWGYAFSDFEGHKPAEAANLLRGTYVSADFSSLETIVEKFTGLFLLMVIFIKSK